MRQKRTVQATLFEVSAQHEIGCELKAMSRWLDGQRALISLVADDLRRQEVRETGRRGLPAESVLRCALLKQQRQLCYEELAFHLEDSASFRAFARLPLAWSPKKSVLHHTIAAIRAETWEAVNQALLASAQKDRLESGAMMRLDSTVTAALMHEPSDSALLWDAVRVMTRLLDRGEALAATPAIRWRDRRRLAKKRARAIEYSRGPNKKRQLYRDLITAAQASRAELQAMAKELGAIAETAITRWRAEVDHYLPLIARVIVQTQRRVFDGQTVPAGDKLVSLFEPHADIIVKGGRQVQYGHKLNLVTGKSGLILDVVIEAGNPADAERFVPMLDRHIARTGVPPRQTAADGGYASRANLAGAKQRGVTDVAFHKKCGIAVADMVKSPWVYRRLRNFRAGIEASISCFKRAYGAARCSWRGLQHFKAYIWSEVVAHNLTLFARTGSDSGPWKPRVPRAGSHPIQQFAPVVPNAGFAPDCRRSWDRDRTAGVDPLPTFALDFRIERVFDFVGYRFSRAGLRLAEATIQKFVERAARLYEQRREQPNGSSRLGV